MAMLSLKRRLGIPANSTAYDEVMTERYLRADLSRTESRVGEFKRHGRFDGTTARFGLEILWEHSPVPFEDIQELHLSLVNWAAAQVWRDNTLTDIPSGLWLDNVGREQENKMGASKQKRREDDGCDHPQDERSPKRKRLE
ncbi:hypothetical protein FRC19_005129 [Serendipita sp. 401]|nr:hypothetical protein FRC19_005129 [Serendipita sp. 401]